MLMPARNNLLMRFSTASLTLGVRAAPLLHGSTLPTALDCRCSSRISLVWRKRNAREDYALLCGWPSQSRCRTGGAVYPVTDAGRARIAGNISISLACSCSHLTGTVCETDEEIVTQCGLGVHETGIFRAAALRP